MPDVVRIALLPVRPVIGLLSTLVRPVGWLLPLGGGALPPNDPPEDDDVVRARVRGQVQVIRDALGDNNVAVCIDGATGHKGSDDADVEYLFRPGYVLVRTSRLDRLHDFFTSSDSPYSGKYDGEGVPDHEVVPDVTLYRLPPRQGSTDGAPADVLTTLRDVNEYAAKGGWYEKHPQAVDRLLATPDHILYVTGEGSLGHVCPATEPIPVEPTTKPFPAPVSDPLVGGGVRVEVVDTGWQQAPTTNPLAAGVNSKTEGEAEIHDDVKHTIRMYEGHGMFVSGIVHCLAPGADIQVQAFLPEGGAVLESHISKQLNDAEGDDPDVISISAGSGTYEDAGLLAFWALAQAKQYVESDGGPLVVAAAGNGSTSKPFYPAAFDFVVAVGAVKADQRTLCGFTNYGKWVDVYAVGADLVNVFPTGTYTCGEYPNTGQTRVFDGLARWSGTSFSTPTLSGMIAAAMRPHGVAGKKHLNARQARDLVLAPANTKVRSVTIGNETFDARTFK